MLWFDFVAIVVGPGIVPDHMRLGISVVTAALLPRYPWLIRLGLSSEQRIQLILLLIIVEVACIVDATHVVISSYVGAREDTSGAVLSEQHSSIASSHEEFHDDFKPGYLGD